MIELKPHPENYFTCPECQSVNPLIRDVIVPSIHVMADCRCGNCGLEFYQLYPVGHAIRDQHSIGKRNGKFYKSLTEHSWFYDAFDKGHRVIRKNKVSVEKRIIKEMDQVVILNTLDFLYGHVLLKLCNSIYHLDNHKDLGLIVIVPKIFEWLIPTECAEVWIVDLKLSELTCGYESIQKFISNEFNRFSKIYLRKAYSHPDFTSNALKRLTGIEPFDLSKFTQRKPTVTFVLREDRWWLTSSFDYWFYRICRFLKILSWGSRILARRQNKLVKATVRILKSKIPEVDIYVVGLGDTGGFAGSAQDERTLVVNEPIEKNWCKIYADSHVVVGVHGSNMLLPTALAAGCVEILPKDRYGNMVQDISVRYNDRKQLFFYRFVDQYANSKSVAAKIVAMITDFEMYNDNMCRNIYMESTAEPKNTNLETATTAW
jgi:hypothetical protein